MKQRQPSSKIDTYDPKLPKLTSAQISVLEEYAHLKICLDDVYFALKGIFEISFERGDEWMKQHFLIPEPRITITREHLHSAVEKKRSGQVEENDLVYWAMMLLMCDAYEFDSKDEDFIGDSLADISYRDIPP
jgi:hypothetical protein